MGCRTISVQEQRILYGTEKFESFLIKIYPDTIYIAWLENKKGLELFSLLDITNKVLYLGRKRSSVCLLFFSFTLMPLSYLVPQCNYAM